MRLLARWPGAGLALVTAGLFLVAGCRRSKAAKYEFGEVTRADIENVVSSTGQMEPVGTVEIGTQVSGIVDRVLVDYNSQVKKGQLLAVLDTVTLAAQVRDAEAGLARADAQMAKAQTDLSRTQELFAKGLSSEQDMEAAKVAAATARAALQSAQSTLDRARANLTYAFIRSPIDGTVIARNVEPGQTVAASLSAPTVFIVAEDLARMRILAQVDESDIGSIDSGLPAKFTVQAFPDVEFTGTATQVRLQPTTSSGVVTYTVVVDAENRDNKLLPGMTATVDFYVQQRENVLTVPSSALKFRPTDEMLKQVRRPGGDSLTPHRPRGFGAPDSSRRRHAGGDSLGRPALPDSVSQLWCVGANGRPELVLVRTGVSDGSRTEVTPLRGELAEGTKVYTRSSGTRSSSSSNRREGPPGGMFGMPPPGR